MSNAQLSQATGVTTAEAKTFPALLAKSLPQIKAALPKHINADRMSRIALTCFRQTPKLSDCDPLSVLACVIQAAQLGLEPGLNGRCYLIPYGNQCTFVPGWKGLLELVNRSGRATAWTGAVFDGDKLEYQLGANPDVRHFPGSEDDPKKMLYTYAIGRIKGNDWPVIEVWTNEKLIRHRDRYNKVGKRHYSFDNWEMYARKIPLLQVLKYLPASPELETAMALADAADAGMSQGLTIDGTLATPFEPPAPRESMDPETGEITGKESTNAPSSADVLAMITKATTTDELDLARDMLRSVPDEAARATLDVEERAKRKKLTP